MGPRHDGDAEGRRRVLEQGLARRPLRVGQHHPLLDRRRQGRRQGHPRRQGQAHGHGLPRADGRVSVVDLTVKPNTATSYDDICAEVSRLADGPMTGILGYCDEPLVSTDFETEPTSSVFDAGAGIMLSPKFVKCVAWYDNE